MSLVSCIYHPERSRYLKIYEHLTQLFDGDTCCSALISMFEGLMTGVSNCDSKLRDDDLWFSLSNQELERRLLGLYSYRTIKAKLGFLEKIGVVDARPNAGDNQPVAYRFNTLRLNDYIHHNKILKVTK